MLIRQATHHDCSWDWVLQEREQLLQEAATGGAVKEQDAWRVSLKGKRFKLKGVKLFNVSELDGERHTCARALPVRYCSYGTAHSAT